ncbi:MAG: DinB family protein [Candidatus Sulfotelmatobacter sp.]
MKRSFVTFLFVSVCVFALALGQAQTSAPSSSMAMAAPQASAPVKDPVSASLRIMITRSQNNILGAIQLMPADKFRFKPTPDQMTFGHLVTHIADTNFFLCAKATDVPAPKPEEVKDTDSKDKLLAAAKASFDFCNDVLSKMDDSKLGESIQLFGPKQFPRAMAALFLANTWADHYAEAATDLRLNGILPPSAQPKK